MSRSKSRTRARALALLVALTAVLVSSTALAAPAFTFTKPNPDRIGAPARDLGRNSNGISFDDCIKDVKLTFSLAVTGLPTADQLQVWGGTGDCSNKDARNPTTSGTCQPLTDLLPIQSATMQVTIRGRDLANINGQASPGNGGGPLAGFVGVQDDKSCYSQTTSAGKTITLNFLAFVSGNNDAETSVAYTPPAVNQAILVDLVGPNPPTAGSIDVGDTLLKIHWTPSGDVTDTAGFKVFCDPPPHPSVPAPTATATATQTCTAAPTVTPDSGGPLTDAGVDGATDADVDAAVDAALDAAVDAPADTGSTPVDAGLICTTPDAGSATCGSGAIKGGVNGSTIDPYYVCASPADKSATEADLSGLTNGQPYAFAIAAIDISGNAGPTVLLDCATPAPISDFWDKYRGYGGRAGGSFCALDAPGAPVGVSLFSIAMIAGIGALARRRRKR